MTYKGKRVIRMVGKIIGRAGGGIMLLEYADHTIECIMLTLCTERGRRLIVWSEAAEEKAAQFPSINKEVWRRAS